MAFEASSSWRLPDATTCPFSMITQRFVIRKIIGTFCSTIRIVSLLSD